MNTITPLLTSAQVAEILGVKAQTLAAWRVLGKGPAFVTAGRAIRYREDLLREWIDANTADGK